MANGLRFNFVAQIDANGLDAKVPFLREFKNDKGKVTGLGLNLVSISEKSNRAFMECAGFINDPIKTKNEDKEDIEIAWDDRFDEEIVDSVVNFRKNVIVLGEDRYEFIATYDFIKFVAEHIDEIKGKRFAVTGRVRKNVYKGKVSDRFEIQNMFELGEDDDRKNGLKVTGEIYFGKDSFDFADWKTEKKIIINGYTREYIDKEHADVFVEKQLVFDCSKLDLEKEKHIKLLKAKFMPLGLVYDEDTDSVSCKCKRGKWYSMSVVTSYINGNEEIAFDESQLTELQKTWIELGMKTLDDFKPKSGVYGDRVVIYRLVDFNLSGDYDNGMVQLDDDVDLEENIYVPSADEKIEDVEKKMESKKSSKKKEEPKEEVPFDEADDDDDDDDDENLFDI